MKEFQKAIEFYKEGALVEDAPVFLYNLAQCYRQLGEYEDAIWHYERFLDAQNPDDEIRMYVRNFIDVMKAELKQKVKNQPPTDPGDDGQRPDADKRNSDDSITVPIKFDAPSPWYADRIGWALAGGGLVIGGIGAGLLVNAAALRSDADRELNAIKRQELRDKADSCLELPMST